MNPKRKMIVIACVTGLVLAAGGCSSTNNSGYGTNGYGPMMNRTTPNTNGSGGGTGSGPGMMNRGSSTTTSGY